MNFNANFIPHKLKEYLHYFMSMWAFQDFNFSSLLKTDV